jgi:methyl-accepting chemotaxis protein
MNVRDLSLGNRLAFGFGTISMLLLAIIAVALNGLSELGNGVFEIGQSNQITNTLRANMQQSYAGTVVTLLFAGVEALLLSYMISCWITLSVSLPVREALSVADMVAAGDLTSVVQPRSKDEPGRLLASMATMNANLTEIVSGVREGTVAIASASAVVASGNRKLSDRTAEHAVSLAGIATTIDALTGAVKANRELTSRIYALAEGASASARQGADVITQVVASMADIRDASNRVNEIVGVIDGIAFQTNILALNAAVEAAHAGDRGSGFAVVAGEVRLLAQRCAESASQIKILISNAGREVDRGNRLVDSAGTSMHNIVETGQNVATLLAEMASASITQAADIERVNEAIMLLDHETQDNSLLVKQAAEAAHTMQSHAVLLEQAVFKFRLAATPAHDHQPSIAAPYAAN